MDAVKYFKEKRRMLNSLGRKSGACTGVMCSNCPFDDTNNGKNLDCTDFEAEYPEEAVAIVEKWEAEHSQKTLLQDFLEKFPNAPMRTDGTPHTCPCVIGYEPFDKCENGCIECWNRPIEG